VRELKIVRKEENHIKNKRQMNLFNQIKSKRLVVASNRLPIVINRSKDGWAIRPGTGGLITALSPIMNKNRGLWIGWPGSAEDIPYEKLLKNFSKSHSYELKPVLISKEEVAKYYHGFSNETLWPLFHDLLSYCKFDKENWIIYKKVNSKFAEVIYNSIKPDDLIWIHDYHLALVGQYLKEKKVTQNVIYFLHIPFPTFDLLRRLPWVNELISGMMGYDLLGFQTLRDQRNFINSVRSVFPGVKIIVKRRYCLILYKDRVIKVGNFPISIDFNEFYDLAKTKKVANTAQHFHEKFNADSLILCVDRLDYTKGIPERLLAFERALEKYPELQGKLTLLQLLIPSRTPVPEYQQLKRQLDTLIGRINGKFSKMGWVPIHYMYRTMSRTELVGCYKACEIALITPLRDGMNLVAKEYCACTIDNNGILVLSEFAGAAEQLKNGAIIVNPYDIEQTAEAIYNAFKMEEHERKARMEKLRFEIRRNDVHKWVNWFIQAFQEPKLPTRIKYNI
jgi:trehalose 6-phosphate synthase/phosphatase